MTAIASAVSFPVMTSRRKPNKAKRVQINFRFEEPFIERMERFAESNQLRPTLTRIIELAVTDWLDKHEPELLKKKHP